MSNKNVQLTDLIYNHHSECNLDYNDDQLSQTDDHVVLKEFTRMYSEYLKEGGKGLPGFIHVDGAIFLENDDSVVAGIFYNLKQSTSNLYVVLAFVEKQYRGNGIYKKLHNLIDVVARLYDKKGIISFISLDDTVMLNTISKSVGYNPIYQLVHRAVSDE